jgi:hypothetical protein
MSALEARRLYATACATTDEAEQEDQDTSTNEGNDDAVDEAITTKTKGIHNETTDKGTDDTNNDITDDAVTTTTHNNTSKEASDQTNDDPENQSSK